jgi:endonuclease/exonuclease/phosphatase family metal-dependent hydrolase
MHDGFDALVASWNIHKCIGVDGAFDPDRTMAVIAELDADLLALQEVDKRFGSRSGLLDMRRLHDECGLVPIPLRPTGKGHGWHGNLVLCREGLVRSARQIALPGMEARGALIADLEMNAGPLRLIAAHLGLLRHSRARQVQAILEAISNESEIPTLLAGDLNEWRLGPRSSLLGLSQAFVVSAPPMPTFPADYPVLALDRLMANHRGMMVHATVHRSPLSRLASDHLPLKAWVKLPDKASKEEA